MRYIHLQTEKGFALLLAIIVSSIALAIGVSILQISVNQINLASTARESEIAFQAASAGVDCLWYWRNTRDSEFTDPASIYLPPGIQCFGGAPRSEVAARLKSVAGYSFDLYTYQFDFGSPTHCVEMDMYIMKNNSPVLASENFLNINGNDGVGTGGLKTCSPNATCTILFSTGYNRSCATLNTSIFSIQRELTVEF